VVRDTLQMVFHPWPAVPVQESLFLFRKSPSDFTFRLLFAQLDVAGFQSLLHEQGTTNERVLNEVGCLFSTR
jgi:hypothetical protein